MDQVPYNSLTRYQAPGLEPPTGSMSLQFQLPTVTFKSAKSYTVVTVTTDQLTMPERASAIASWISVFRDRCATLDQVVETMVNLMATAVPGLANEFVKCQTVSIVNKSISKADYLMWLGIEDRPVNWASKEKLPTLPREPTETSVGLSNSLNAYAGLAIILYSVGKEIRADNTAAVTTNRPKVVHDKYGLPEGEFKSAPGKPDGPSMEALSQIYSAFSVVTEPRAVIIRSFLSLYRASSHYAPEIDVVMVMFRLLDGAQMAHVGFIQDMIEAHPWLLKVPSLRPSIKEYIAELKRFSNVPEPVRGYVRLLEGNHAPFFPAPKMAPLVAVAVALKKEIEGTLANYMGGKDQYQHIVNEVMAIRDSFKMKAGVDELSKELGVPDVELPVQAMLSSVAPQILTPKTT